MDLQQHWSCLSLVFRLCGCVWAWLTLAVFHFSGQQQNIFIFFLLPSYNLTERLQKQGQCEQVYACRKVRVVLHRLSQHAPPGFSRTALKKQQQKGGEKKKKQNKKQTTPHTKKAKHLSFNILHRIKTHKHEFN